MPPHVLHCCAREQIVATRSHLNDRIWSVLCPWARKAVQYVDRHLRTSGESGKRSSVYTTPSLPLANRQRIDTAVKYWVVAHDGGDAPVAKLADTNAQR